MCSSDLTIFFREYPSIYQVVGIATVSAGVIAIGVSHRATSRVAVGLSFALATGFTIGCYTVIDAAGVRLVENPLSYVLWFFVAHGASVVFTAPGIRGGAVIVEAGRHWRLGALTAALSIITYGSAMLAYRFGATAQLAALRETSVLFGTAMAMQFLGEPMNAQQWGAAVLIVAGAILLQF